MWCSIFIPHCCHCSFIFFFCCLFFFFFWSHVICRYVPRAPEKPQQMPCVCTHLVNKANSDSMLYLCPPPHTHTHTDPYHTNICTLSLMGVIHCHRFWKCVVNPDSSFSCMSAVVMLWTRTIFSGASSCQTQPRTSLNCSSGHYCWLTWSSSSSS